MDQNNQIFSNAIKQIISSALQPQNLQLCIDSKSTSVSKLYITLIDKFEADRQDITDLNSKLYKQLNKNKSFAEWIGRSFLYAYLKVKANQTLKLKKNQNIKFLECPADSFAGDIYQFLKNSAEKFNIDNQKLKKISDQIQNSKEWRKLKKVYEVKKKEDHEQDQKMFEKSIEKEQKIENQNLIKKMQLHLEEIQNPENIYYLIQKNLIDSFQYQTYSRDKFDQFIHNLINKCKELQLPTYEIQKENTFREEEGNSKDYFYNKILNIRGKIHSIYIPELLNLLESNRKAEQQLRNKDIFVILGRTGSGKSTFIQLLLGYQLIKKKIKGKLTTLCTKPPLRQQHKCFIAKPNTKSVTKNISAIQWNSPKYLGESKIFLVDTPGFFDTNGLIVEASNALSTIRALNQANSIRLGILINVQIFSQRSAGFKQLIQVIQKIFYTNFRSQNLIYILNRVTDDILDELPARIQDLIKNMNPEQKGNDKMVIILQHLKKLFKEASKSMEKNDLTMREAIQDISQLIIMDPDNFNEEEISTKIFNKKRKLFPSEEPLNDMISKKVELALKKQTGILFRFVKYYLKNEKMECAYYFIELLRKLAQQTKDKKEITHAQLTLEKLITDLEIDFMDKFKKFDDFMTMKIKYLGGIEQQMQEAKGLKEELQKLQTKYAEIPGMQNCNKKKDINRIIQSTEQFLFSQLEKKFDKPVLGSILLFSKHFQPQMEKKLIQKIKNLKNELGQSIKESIEQEDFITLQEKLYEKEKIHSVLINMKFSKQQQHNLENLLENEEEWKKILDKKIEAIIKKFQSICSRYSMPGNRIINPKDLQYVEKIFKKMKNFSYKNRDNLNVISNAEKRMGKDFIDLGKSYIRLIRQFIGSDFLNDKQMDLKANGVRNAKDNLNLMIKKVDLVKEQIQGQLDYELNCLSQKIQKNIHKVQISKLRQREDWHFLNQVYRSLCILKKLSQISEGNQEKNLEKLIKQKQSQIENKLKREADNLNMASFNLDSKQSFQQALSLYKFMILDQEPDIEGNNKIFKACSKIKQIIQSKIKSILQQIQKLRDPIKSDKQKEKFISNQIQKIGKIIQMMQIIKRQGAIPLNMRKDVAQCEGKFIIKVKQSFKLFNEKIMPQLQNIYNLIDNFKSNSSKQIKVIQKKNLQFIVAKRNSSIKISNNHIIKQLFSKDYKFAQQQIQFQQKIDQIKGLAENVFEQFKENENLKICSDFLEFCKDLPALDSMKSLSNKRTFKDILNNFKNQWKDMLSANDLAADPSKIFLNGNLEINLFKKVYSFYTSFGRESIQFRQIQKMIELIQTYIRDKQNNLINMLNRFATRNPSDDQNDMIDNIYHGITKVLQTTKQIAQVMGKQKSSKIEIKKQTKEKIYAQSKQIINSCQKRAKQKINQGGQGYKEAEVIIQKLRYMQILFSDIQQLRKVMGEKNVSNEDLAQNLQNELKKTKEERETKYLKSPKIQINKHFINDLNTFTSRDRQEIQSRVLQNLKDEIKRFIKKSKKLTIKELGQNLDKQDLKLQFLTSKLKNEIRQAFEYAIKNEKETRKQQSQQIMTSFNIESAYDLIKQQNRPYILEIYGKSLEQYFNQGYKKLKVQKSTQNQINLLTQYYVSRMKGKSIHEKNNCYTLIYAKYLALTTKLIKQNIIKQKVKKIANLIQQRQDKIYQPPEIFLNQIRSHERDLNILWIFLDQEKQIFHQYSKQKKQDLDQLFSLSSQFYNKYLSKKTRELTNEKIKNDWEILSTWNINKEYYLTLTTCLQSQYQKQKDNNQKIIQEQRKIVNHKFEQMQRDAKQKLVSLKNFHLYSEDMKNNSNNQRAKTLKLLDENYKTLVGFSKSKIYKQINPESLELIKNSIFEAFQQGIERSCKYLKQGYRRVQEQFNKEINLSLAIIKIAPENLSFIRFDDRKKQQIGKQIQQNERAITRIMKECSVKIKPFKDKIKNDANKLPNNYGQIDQQIKKRTDEVKKQIDSLRKQLKIDINNEGDNLQNIQKLRINCQNQIKQKEKDLAQFIDNLEEQRLDKQQKLLKDEKAKIQPIIEAYVQNLTIYYKSTIQINYEQQTRKQDFDQRIQQDRKTFGLRAFNQIYEILNRKNKNYGNLLIKTHEIFKSNQIKLWKTKIQSNGIQYVLDNLSIEKQKKNNLRILYKEYKNQFDKWIKLYSESPSKPSIQKLQKEIKKESKKIQEYYHNKGSADIKKHHLIANIFALWTIINSGIQDEQVQFLYQPHPAQVITIFLCLSFLDSDQPKNLQSKMAQIGTGEGKSVVLAGISAYLALCGFQVTCVCYSQYLSCRDKQKFLPLFQELQISSKVTYGTFETACQSLLKKGKDDEKSLRDYVKDIFETGGPGFIEKIIKIFLGFFNGSQLQNKKIMLIDEVDVFFDRSYFGSLYCPDISLSSPEIAILLKQVWQGYLKNPKISDKQMNFQDQIQKIIARYSKLDKILDQQLKGMILGCRGSDHNYRVKDDKIVYKQQDGISSKVNFGYQTLFAYLKEHSKSKISSNSLQNALKISLIIAQFSYSMLPKYFKSIIGVTGTFQSLSQNKKIYMRQTYKVKDIFIIPSVYGNKSRRQINRPKIINTQDKHKKISQEIRLIHQSSRPIIVFFKNMDELHSLFNSKIYSELQQKTTFLDETHPPNDRDLRIKKACNKNNITFMTNSFGRGTDFVVYDQKINQIGGLYVIQTFISDDKSQEIQIQGRTARQGNKGTYSLVFPQQQLQKFNLRKKEIKNFQSQLNIARQNIQNVQWKQIMEKMIQNQKKHEICLKTYKNQKLSDKQIVEFIYNLNKYPQIRNSSCKTLIMVDATGSMSSILRKLTLILEEVVQDVIQIVGQTKNVSSSQLQLFIYRNYNSPFEKLFQSTPFTTQSNQLVSFLKKVQADGGWGRQALQIGYYHINSVSDISQVILIGDAPANTFEETRSKRKDKGEQYWISQNLPIISAQQQLYKIISKRIPIHSFYVNTQPNLCSQQYFKQVSKKTGGDAEQFFVNNPNSSKKLSKFIAQRILRIIAVDKNQGQIFVNAYRKRHSKQ